MQEPKEFRLDTGDVELAVVEWAGSGDPILLLHATGFHSRCWNEVVKHLPGRHIYAVDLRFHGASGEAGDVDWGIMAEDIRILIERLELRDLIGVGHSIGGHLIARVAAKQPTVFKHLVLIDPVIMSPERYSHFQSRADGFSAKDHPVSRRKNSWSDAKEMFDRFVDRAPFNTWQPQVLQDYCDYALRPADENSLHALACDPINEARIYLHQTGNEVLLDALPQITTAVTLLRAAPGDDSAPNLSTSPTWPELAAALPQCTEIFLPEMNHFIPMQDPALVARHIKSVH
ncbi:MAG: pimeloyl-ACP methyl ester carboxylesterase [Halioglobus sp.]|jgi:pimeloyl-ACP methyl ester carboxylesterase